MRRIFFGFGHGNGEDDRARAAIKWALTHEPLKTNGVHMNCVAHVVDFSRTNMSSSAIGVYSSHVRDIKMRILRSENT